MHTKRADPFRASVPWLIKTTYISNEYDVVKRGTSNFERLGNRARQAQREDVAMDTDTMVRNIEKSFEQAQEDPVHPLHPNLKADAIYPIFPDPDHENAQCVHAIFDEDPRRLHNVGQNIDERFAQSLLVGETPKETESSQDESEDQPQKPVTLIVPVIGSHKRMRQDGSNDAIQEFEHLRDYYYEFKPEHSAYVFGFPNLDEVPSGTPVYYYKLGTRVMLRKKKKEKLVRLFCYC